MVLDEACALLNVLLAMSAITETSRRVIENLYSPRKPVESEVRDSFLSLNRYYTAD